MLRNLENIWSKGLVNSEEFAMFVVPNIYNLGMLCLYISKDSQYSGVSLTHNSLRLWVFGDIWRGSASSFVQKIINQIFSCQMPNTTENLKSEDNSTLTSTQPSEKGKSQSKLEKDKKSFGYSRNVRMFAVFKTKRTNLQTEEVFFIPEHFLSKNKTVGLPVASSLLCDDVRLVTNGRLDSLSLFNSFKFINK